ncbi:DUF4625 domain-containing protein [Thermophagus sp. OGC60D27]|uniref:DUF4625 domain-containing protein n=1 Tax=Thermophagus sp. OGC60D27 TaxID=3458415 RepID=UPI004037E7DD
MKRSFIYFFLVTALSVFALAACGGDDDPDPDPGTDPEETVDKEKPTISLTSPKEGDEFENDGIKSIFLNGTLEDNEELDSCVVSVSYNEKSASLKSVPDPEPFNHEKSYSLSGKSHEFENEDPFGIIDNATPGEYTFSIKVMDAEGNEAEDSFTITIKEPVTE